MTVTVQGIFILLLCLSAIAHAQAPLDLAQSSELPQPGHLYLAGSEAFPATTTDVPQWLAQRQPAEKISLLGGSYWLYAEIRHNGDDNNWIVNPNNTLIEQLEWRVYDPEGQVQIQRSGYTSDHEYMLHYGKDIRLQPNVNYRLLLKFSSPYFASYPRFGVESEQQYQHKVVVENIQIIGTLGALLSLAVYNFFIYTLAREKSRLYYAAYLVAFCLGWAFVFHIPAELFGLHDLRLHYLPFFLLPVLNTLFYLTFLDLPAKFPRLAAISRINLWLPLLLLPSCFFALSYAHLLATLAITFWLSIALISGIACLRTGYRPARYFVLAFITLWASGALILPANIGITSDIIYNSELLTLMCGALDALLLAFALADQIRLLAEEKDNYLNRYENINRLLKEEVKERLNSEKRILLLNAELETKVQNRTYDLLTANDKLQEEIHERKQIELELNRAKELAEAANKAKTEFLASISHELRTPLNGILGFTQIMQTAATATPVYQEYLAAIRRSGDYLLTLINDLLDLSKIEAGRLELSNTNFDIENFLLNVLDIFRFRAMEKGIEFRCVKDSAMPNHVFSDEKRLRQVLINLLSNAIKFTRKGYVLLEISYAAGMATFKIEDSGDGIAHNDLERIFLPFERLEYHSDAEGTGLGLAISKRLIESMQGSIDVVSELGQGSTFRVTLPLPAASARPHITAMDRSAQIVGYQGKPRKVLIVDDIPDNVQVLQVMLAPLGFIIDTAQDGETCLAKCASFRPDIILLDILMPNLDGLETAAILRQTAHGEHIGIIAVTANAFEENRRACLAAGFDDLITKPIQRDQLLEQIGYGLDLRWRYANAPSIGALPIIVSARTLRVLIADDNAMNRTLFKAQFRNIDAQIHEASDGLQALRDICVMQFDFIFLDLRMPLMTGADIMRQLKLAEHNNHATPIIAVTAFIPPEQEHALLSLGFSEILIKPIAEAQIYEIINRYREYLPDLTPVALGDESDASVMASAFYADRMLNNTDRNKNLLATMLPKLFDEIPVQLGEVEQSICDANFDLATEILHKLHGSLSFFGLIDMKFAAANLESALIEKRDSDIAQYLMDLKQTVNAFLALKNLILQQLDAMKT